MNIKAFNKAALLAFGITLCAVLFCTTETMAQPRNRNFIKECIAEYGSCRNVAITKYNGDVMLYGRNGWAAEGCPKGLTDALNDLNDDGETIVDVQLTESGDWLILYGDNGLRWSDIPQDLEDKLREWNADGETITSVAFNDSGDWVAICESYVSSSDEDIQEWMVEGMDDYGTVWAACVTEDAIVLVYESGYSYLGEIPSTLEDALYETDLDVFYLKIAGDSWFMADKDGSYAYNM